MGKPRPPQITPRAERRAIIALLAVFALMVQALVPSLAAAGPLAGPGMTVCTEMGLIPTPVDGGPATAPAHGCDHCLCPAAGPGAPAGAATAAEVVCCAAAVESAPPRNVAVAPGRGLAAPPPPSRGPPHSEA